MAEAGMQNLEQLYVRKILRRVEEVWARFVWSDRVNIEDVAVAETMEHLSPRQGAALQYARVGDGFRWGKPWSTAWFRLRFRVPDCFRGDAIALRFDTGGQGLIFRNGRPLQALDNGRDTYLFSSRARGGERVELFVEAGASGSFGDFGQRVMRQPTIAVLNEEVWDAHWDLSALADMIDPTERKVGWAQTHSIHALNLDDTRRARIIFVLNRAVDLFDYGNPSRDELRAQARAVRKALAPLYACHANDSEQTIACLGHAHIDVAWLWPLAETVRKCGRTFSNVVDLMDRYPEFKFVQSQPQLYEYTRKRYPELYQRMRDKVRGGQWLPTGCMWVEADCNVTSGESLVRQTLFGTRFFREEFGHEVCCLWLPDVFGYSAALPQLMKRSGIDYFLTQKISWSQFTTFPYHSFRWEGIDGTELLTHFVPADNYNCMLKADEMISAARRYRERDRSPVQVVPYGFGDGGGGPTRDMLERRRRYEDLEGMPKLQPMSPSEFFSKLENESTDLPRWVGELYLEYHRGTYTTQAYNKRNNRLSELLLRDAELLSAVGAAHGSRYEQDRLNACWKLVLLNQFHDIIPGSSIDEVYKDSDRDYREVLDTAGAVKSRAFASLSRKADTRGTGAPVVAFNSLAWERKDEVAVPVKGLRRDASYVAIGPDGAESPVQRCEDGAARFRAKLPPMGFSVFHIRRGGDKRPDVHVDPMRLENDSLRVVFDRQGRIRRVRDKAAGRDVLAPKAIGNRCILFEDKMVTCGEAWDVDIFYNDKPLVFDGQLISVEPVEQGPVRSVLRVKRAISKSVITQDIILHSGSDRLDFASTVAWGDEKDVILKVAFPVNVRSDEARYEIQFGNVERPTHWNRPQDFGMFEVPAQRWVDLSEADYGVALLNDCKYGHDTRDNVIRLTLLRAPRHPGKTADVNKTHVFTYSILPHTGGYVNGVVRAGYELNVPVTAGQAPVHAGALGAEHSFFGVNAENVIVDTVKKAEDDGGIIVRLYEAHGCRGRCVLSTSLPLKGAVETDLMEHEEGSLIIRNGRIGLDFRPFQIRTLKLIPA